MTNNCRNFFTIACLAALPLLSQAATVVVVNRSNPISEISLSQLRKIMMGGQTKWPGGAAVSVLLGSSGQPERKAAIHRYCGMNESEFATFFLKASFRGEAISPPRSMPTGASIVQVVQMVFGAIGVISSDDVNDKVKVVHILGDAAPE